jgi:hypothetical protein
MGVLLPILGAVALVVVGAAYLQNTSFGWPFLVCSYSFGLCGYPNWVAIGAVAMFVAYFAYRSWV